METWDFFIAHSSQDTSVAENLFGLLAARKARVFLDTKRLGPGSQWGRGLKQALARSRVIIVLVSRHSDKSWYLEEEIAIAVQLVRTNTSAYLIVPVLLKGARLRDLQYGLNKLTFIREEEKGLPFVVDALLRERTRLRPRAGTRSLAHAVDIVDEFWSHAEPALTGRKARTPDKFRLRFAADGSDMVSLMRGKEQQRITRAQFKRKLKPAQMEFVETLERSMELNRALWREAYPNRTASRTDRKKAEAAMAAMAEDLKQVLALVEAAGFWLDDHYHEIRVIAEAVKKKSKPGS